MPLDFLQTCFTPIEHCMCTGLQNRCKNRMKEWVAERCTKAFFPRKPLLRMIPVDLVWDPPSNLLLLPQSQFSFESCKLQDRAPNPPPFLHVIGKHSRLGHQQIIEFFSPQINSSPPLPIPLPPVL